MNCGMPIAGQGMLNLRNFQTHYTEMDVKTK